MVGLMKHRKHVQKAVDSTDMTDITTKRRAVTKPVNSTLREEGWGTHHHLLKNAVGSGAAGKKPKEHAAARSGTGDRSGGGGAAAVSLMMLQVEADSLSTSITTDSNWEGTEVPH